MGLLEGCRAIVTGGASGIGAATCRRFAEEGAAVVVLDVDGDGARAVAERAGCDGAGGRCGRPAGHGHGRGRSGRRPGRVDLPGEQRRHRERAAPRRLLRRASGTACWT